MKPKQYCSLGIKSGIVYIFITICLLLIYFPNISYAQTDEVMESQKSSWNISSFLKESKQYTGGVLEDVDMNELLNSAIKGEVDNSTLGKKIFNVFGVEIKNALKVLGSVLIIVVIHSVLKSITENLGNESVGQITYYVQYILIATLIMTNFAQVIEMTKEAVNNLVGFTHLLIPLLMTLMLATGSIASVGMIEPVLLFMINLIGNLFQTVLVPVVLIATVLAIISKISDKVQIDKLSKFLKSSTVWVIGIILTLFVGILSIEGTLSSSVDGVTAKTTKAAVSTFIPVVGKVLGDAVDTVMGCSVILKNAVGMLGVMVIIGICIMPIAKLAILTVSYHLTAAICQPIADTKIVKLLEQMGDTFKILLAILCSISVMLIIGITLVIKITNSGMMYR